ncbi:MAG: 2-isopropylmalate synthase [Candidatus Entotheonella factor]|uniref:2-isopropylmalate synthase n=1 Tax=Entotheonella factor TaxID=1429438 RepID=W4L6G0_ENTF1|nr:2-isopropylmalate synthase [Candidatus Entotheonella palauensis]ETW92916.1 MAG: 2-isopropylmalate synthase [Candidatus Entotheonella factor]
MHKVDIFDTTLRDGEQSPGCSLNAAEKLEIAHQLARTGVDVIEAGFAASSPGDFAAVKMIAEQVRGPVITALARGVRSDIEAVAEAVKPAERPRIHIVVSASDIHLERKMRKSKDEVLQMGVDSVRFARQFCDDVEYSTEDASRADLDYLSRTLEAVIDAGATVINLPDTVGYAVPGEWFETFMAVMNRVPNIDKAKISVHCHDDLGMGVANSLEAIRAGVKQVEGCFNGIGERAGNASLEEIIVALHMRPDYYNAYTDVNLKELYRTCQLIANRTGMPIPRNKAIVGGNAFAHSSGIHQDGIIKDRSNYEIISPELIGLETSDIVLSARSGRAALSYRLKALGYELAQDELNEVYQRFLEVADRKKEVMDEDLRAIMNDQVVHIPETFKLEHMSISSVSGETPSASVSLRVGEELKEATAQGNGPLDAAYRAVDVITEFDVVLDDYSVRSVTEGQEAMGEATVKIRDNGTQVIGRAATTDVVEASVRAYVNAMNKIVEERATRGEKVPQLNVP